MLDLNLAGSGCAKVVVSKGGGRRVWECECECECVCMCIRVSVVVWYERRTRPPFLNEYMSIP